MRRIFFAAVLTLTGLGSSFLLAEEPKPRQTVQPLIVVNFASLENSLRDIGTMFDVAGRSDMREVIDAFIDEKFAAFEGIDRTRPWGGMAFLDDSLPPQMRVVGYLPFVDEEAFVKTLGVIPNRQVNRTGENSLSWDRGKRKTHVRLVNNYALFLDGDESLLDRDLPDPATVAGDLTRRYDLAVDVRLDTLPPLIRDVFLGMFRSQSDAQLQKRDRESAAGFEARRTMALSRVELVTQLVRDGRKLTFGIDAAADGKSVTVDLMVDAKADSEFGRFLQNIPGRPSRFTPLLNDDNPLTLSACWNPDQRQQDSILGALTAFGLQLENQFPSGADSVNEFIRTLKKTAVQSPIDLFVQIRPQADRQFALLGGVVLSEPASTSTALRHLITTIGEARDPEAVVPEAHEHSGVLLHKIGANPSEKKSGLFGDGDVYVGVGGDILWLGMGSPGVLRALDSAIDRISTAGTPSKQSRPPLELVARLAAWLEADYGGGPRRSVRELADSAFEEDADAIRVEFQPTETGGKVHMTFDGGFVRFIGLWFAQRYDRTQL